MFTSPGVIYPCAFYYDKINSESNIFDGSNEI